AFAAYALLLDHDRLLQSAGKLRRSVLAVALATRLVPALERAAVGVGVARGGRGGRAWARAAAVAAPRRLARALAQPRRIDGGARLRPPGPHERAAAGMDAAPPHRRRECGRGLLRSSAVALARIERLTYSYPGAARPALDDVSLTV